MSPTPFREQLHRWFSEEGERLGLLWRRGWGTGEVCPFFTILRSILKRWEGAGEVTDSSSRGPESGFRYP